MSGWVCPPPSPFVAPFFFLGEFQTEIELQHLKVHPLAPDVRAAGVQRGRGWVGYHLGSMWSYRKFKGHHFFILQFFWPLLKLKSYHDPPASLWALKVLRGRERHEDHPFSLYLNLLTAKWEHDVGVANRAAVDPLLQQLLLLKDNKPIVSLSLGCSPVGPQRINVVMDGCF